MDLEIPSYFCILYFFLGLFGILICENINPVLPRKTCVLLFTFSGKGILEAAKEGVETEKKTDHSKKKQSDRKL